MVTNFMEKNSKMSQNELTNHLEQIQKDETDKFAGLESLDEQRLETVRDLEAMLALTGDGLKCGIRVRRIRLRNCRSVSQKRI